MIIILDGARENYGIYIFNYMYIIIINHIYNLVDDIPGNGWIR